MWPEMGKYTVTIASAYAVTIILTLALIVTSLRAATKSKKQLAELEARRNG